MPPPSNITLLFWNGCLTRKPRETGTNGGTSIVPCAMADPHRADVPAVVASLQSAGIRSELHPAVEQHPAALDDTPQKVMVPEGSLEEAQHAIEAMTDPDELIGGR